MQNEKKIITQEEIRFMFVGGTQSIPPEPCPLKSLSQAKYAAIYELSALENYKPIIQDISLNLETYEKMLSCDNPLGVHTNFLNSL